MEKQGSLKGPTAATSEKCAFRDVIAFHHAFVNSMYKVESLNCSLMYRVTCFTHCACLPIRRISTKAAVERGSRNSSAAVRGRSRPFEHKASARNDSSKYKDREPRWHAGDKRAGSTSADLSRDDYPSAFSSRPIAREKPWTASPRTSAPGRSREGRSGRYRDAHEDTSRAGKRLGQGERRRLKEAYLGTLKKRLARLEPGDQDSTPSTSRSGGLALGRGSREHNDRDDDQNIRERRQNDRGRSQGSSGRVFPRDEESDIEDREPEYRTSAPKFREDDNTRQARRASQTSTKVPVSIPYTTAASEFLYGSSVVTAALRARRRKLYNLYLHPRAEQDWEDAAIRSLARTAGVNIKDVGNDWLPVMDKMSVGRPHNGCILEASPLPKLPVTGLRTSTQKGGYFNVELGRQQREDQLINGTNDRITFQNHGWRHPFILFLDGVLDEGNLGAILRSAYYLGVDAVALPVYRCAPLSPITLKASAGAAEALQILSVDRPASFLDTSATHGWRVYGAVAPQITSSADTHSSSASRSTHISRTGPSTSPPPSPPLITFTTPALPTRPLPAHSPLAQHPAILMLGGEGAGLRQGVLNRAQYFVGVNPVRDVEAVGVDSLNVSVAAALLCAEFMRRPEEGRGAWGERGSGSGRRDGGRKGEREMEGLLF